MNALARKVGWRTALKERVAKTNPTLYEQINDEASADFRFLLPLLPHSKVLDIGGGLRTTAFDLQPHCGSITLVAFFKEQAKFIEIRREQERLTNMEVVIADRLPLPFAPETFDVIIVNGSLEWMGQIDRGQKPQALYGQFLKQLHQLLKPGGAIYIGTENRFGIRRILNEGVHRQSRYGGSSPSSFPWVMALFRRFSFKRSDRLSQGGYRKLLEESGFVESQFFMPIPGYHRPVELISLDHPTPLQFYFNQRSSTSARFGKLKENLALWGTSLGVISFLSPHFSMIAWKKKNHA